MGLPHPGECGLCPASEFLNCRIDGFPDAGNMNPDKILAIRPNGGEWVPVSKSCPLEKAAEIKSDSSGVSIRPSGGGDGTSSVYVPR